jgi:ankyrin repeat protein
VAVFDDDNHLHVAAFLIAHGADVNGQNTPLGQTALHAAALAGSARMVEMLLKESADPNARDRAGQTALHLAYRDKRVAELLIERGADVNARDKKLETPLHRAAYAGETAIIAMLLAGGADPNAKNSTGQTPLQLAISRNRKDVAELLEKKEKAE